MISSFFVFWICVINLLSFVLKKNEMKSPLPTHNRKETEVVWYCGHGYWIFARPCGWMSDWFLHGQTWEVRTPIGLNRNISKLLFFWIPNELIWNKTSFYCHFSCLTDFNEYLIFSLSLKLQLNKNIFSTSFHFSQVILQLTFIFEPVDRWEPKFGPSEITLMNRIDKSSGSKLSATYTDTNVRHSP